MNFKLLKLKKIMLPREVEKNGYAVRKSFNDIDPKVIKFLLKLARNNKNTYVDRKRWLTHGIEKKFKSKYMKSFYRKFRKSVPKIHINRRLGLLYSEENCPRQEIHRDRDFGDQEIKEIDFEVYTSILALMDNTKIMIRRKKINLKAGEMIFFKPTTLHCGLEYDVENIRLIHWAYHLK